MTQTLPVIAQKSSYKITVKKGQKYVWCSCGLSKKQPFCDGLHRQYKNSDGSPVMRPVIFEASKDEIISFCGCKKSKKGMFCDGSHKNL